MSPFLIFAIVLTVAYIIYYAVMITRDLYGKNDEENKHEEVFDVGDMDELEEAVVVSEKGNGFSVADKQYETTTHTYDEIPEDIKVEKPAQPEPNQTTKKDIVKIIEAKVLPKMQVTHIYMEDQMMQDDTTACILNGGDRGIGKPRVIVTSLNDEL